MRKRNREETTVPKLKSDETIKEEDMSGSDPLDICYAQPLITSRTSTSQSAAQSKTPSPRPSISLDAANPPTNLCPAKRRLEENDRNNSAHGSRVGVTTNRRGSSGGLGRLGRLSCTEAVVLKQAKDTNKYRRMKLRIEKQKLAQLVEIKNILKEYVNLQNGCFETSDSLLQVDNDDDFDSFSDNGSFRSETSTV